MRLRLPPGYRAHFYPDVLVLERADGFVVARFSALWFAAEEVERTAWEDYGEAAGDPSPSRAPSWRRRLPSRARVRPWPPRPPG